MKRLNVYIHRNFLISENILILSDWPFFSNIGQLFEPDPMQKYLSP